MATYSSLTSIVLLQLLIADIAKHRNKRKGILFMVLYFKMNYSGPDSAIKKYGSMLMGNKHAIRRIGLYVTGFQVLNTQS
jgi:hypothetical protein